MSLRRLSIGLCLFLLGSPGAAETIEIAGWYAPPDTALMQFQTLAVGTFEGEDGAANAAAIEDRIIGARGLEGVRLFTPDSRQRDVVLDARTSTRVDESSYSQSERRCPDGGSNCEEKDKTETSIQCQDRSIRIDVALRILQPAMKRATVLPSFRKNSGAHWCGSEGPPRAVSVVIPDMIDDIAEQFVRTLLPRFRTDRVKLREDRKGLSGDAARQFRAGLAESRTNSIAACARWTAIAATAKPTPALLFNLGLCAEADGKLDQADQLHREAARLAPDRLGDIAEALTRIARRRDAQAIDARRAQQGDMPNKG